MDLNQALSAVRAFLATTQGKVVAVIVGFALLTGAVVLTSLKGSGPHGSTASSSGSPTPGASADTGATPGASVSPGASPNASGTPVLRVGPSGLVGPSGPTEGPVRTANGWVYYPVNYWSGAANTQGITSSQITLCMHAALTLGNIFNETAADVTTYWRWLNDNGGVNGRTVNMQLKDDAYTPQGAKQAASECEATNPFFVMGGIGFDQDPVVRSVAEQDHFPYLYTTADDGSGGSGPPKSYKYSFTGAPTIEQLGTWMGQVAIKQGKGPYGAVYVQDSNWIGGYTTFRNYLDGHGGSSVDQNSYTMNAGGDASAFDVDIQSLKSAGVKTVYLWMNAVGADAFVKKASSSPYNYRPAYVTPDGFDLVTGTVGQSIDDQSGSVAPALAGWSTPAFEPNNQGLPYAADMAAMIAAYNKYDNGHVPDDIDWQAWLAFKSVTEMLKTCGRGCTRNDVVGMFMSGWSQSLSPLCPADYGPNHNFGGKFMNLWQATRVPYVSTDYPSANQHTVWHQLKTCLNNFS